VPRLRGLGEERLEVPRRRGSGLASAAWQASSSQPSELLPDLANRISATRCHLGRMTPLPSFASHLATPEDALLRTVGR
jgi:hypothetical protein